MTTLKDIAAQVGVDISTVSKVLQGAPIRVSPATRDEIHRVAQEMNYRPNTVARGLRKRKSGAVALVVPTITNYLYPEIVRGVQDAAESTGTVLFLFKTSPEQPEEQITSVVAQGRVDGLLFADDMPSPNFHHRLDAEKIPFVSLNRLDVDGVHAVALDDRAGFDAQAAYLTSLGHRQMVFIAVSPQSYVATICEEVFSNGLVSRGAPVPLVLRCDFYGNDIHRVVEELVASDRRPTAIATASVLVAIRLMAELRAKGISVPKDISVIGYHDSPAAAGFLDGVTTVRMPSYQQGRRGMERLLQVIDGQEFTGEILSLEPEIIERGTCARL